MSNKGDDISKKLKEMSAYLQIKIDSDADNSEGPQFMLDLVNIVEELNLSLQVLQKEVGVPDSFVHIDGPHRIR